MSFLQTAFFATSRRTFLWMAAALTGMLFFGAYLQYVVGLVPCPMCIVQRYIFIVLIVFALLGAVANNSRSAARSIWLLSAATAVAGAYVAARQSYLQWNPPEVSSCGRDFYGMIEQMPLSRALPQIFAGSGDCSKVDWTFLGGTIANWAFVVFVAVAVVAVGWLLALSRRR